MKINMKLFFIISMFLSIGCSSTVGVRKTYTPSGEEGFYLDCPSGMSQECIAKAKESCGDSFRVLNRYDHVSNQKDMKLTMLIECGVY